MKSLRFLCKNGQAHFNYLVLSEEFDVLRFGAQRLVDRWLGQCQRLNATYTHIIFRAAARADLTLSVSQERRQNAGAPGGCPTFGGQCWVRCHPERAVI